MVNKFMNLAELLAKFGCFWVNRPGGAGYIQSPKLLGPQRPFRAGKYLVQSDTHFTTEHSIKIKEYLSLQDEIIIPSKGPARAKNNKSNKPRRKP